MNRNSMFIYTVIDYALYDRNLISNWVYSHVLSIWRLFFDLPYNLIKTDTVAFCIFHFPSKGSPSRYYLAFAYFFANFNLGLFMKVLLNEKECTFLTAAHFIYYFLILFLDFDIFFFFQRISWKNKILEILVYFAKKH